MLVEVNRDRRGKEHRMSHQQDMRQDAGFMAGCLVGDEEGRRAAEGRPLVAGKEQHVNANLMRPIEAGAVERCLAGTAADWYAFVRFCHAMFEPAILRAMCRRGRRYQDLARDGFQDLCCQLLVKPAAVLASFDPGRASLRTHLARWVGRRVWMLMHRYERCEQRRPLVEEPVSPDPGFAETEKPSARLKVQAQPVLSLLTKPQRRLVEDVLDGRPEVLDRLSQTALRKTLYRVLAASLHEAARLIC
jgi:hypothetical protein